MNAQGGREIALLVATVIYFSNQTGETDLPGLGNQFQLIPERIFQREAGAMAMECRGMFADHAETRCPPGGNCIRSKWKRADIQSAPSFLSNLP